VGAKYTHVSLYCEDGLERLQKLVNDGVPFEVFRFSKFQARRARRMPDSATQRIMADGPSRFAWRETQATLEA
jgi:hypothetical protein